ncbi:exodeoxyribonuclease V subunit beta [Eleftheria terrae]|uniref:exodeoxyribonuclease V subunit beta n=1 Tax=Eleftheria terrae TaxID=1597781 RepID=UPI00263B085C|nr:exodeoxyribonuclease V subunit beta [Eleftheria terrae]WKB53087.1 exodeoxyribonuclease V subunit beta [Eleftheria terrae]
MSEALDVLRLPLWGSRLIEASAGTGKTWTIAAVYLRLVLGHGEAGAAFGRALLPAEILVMTFTRAATRELSDRIRARLLDAARCFRGQAEPAPHDSLLQALLEAHPEGEARRRAAWRLASAAEAMDDAAVFTIDAWCQRMLREHAFDSGCLFDEELLADESRLLQEAARDYWRQQVYPLDGRALEAVLAVWPHVDELQADVASLQAHPQRHRDGALPPLGVLALQLYEERDRALAALKAGWADKAERMRAWLDGHYEAQPSPLQKQSLKAHHYQQWLQQLRAWALDPQADAPDLGKGAERLTVDGLRAVWKGPEPAWPQEFADFARLQAGLRQLPEPQATLRLHAAAWVARRLAALKQQAGSFGFADMLERLDAALAGPNGERLRERVLQQYPVALIDEFQDTSPLQYRLFDRLYRTADNDPATALFLIGDPKQSIYRFRGADIYSYLDARHATAGRHYMLGTNYRSTARLVAAVNQLFVQAEQRPGGAFLFRAEGGENRLPFEPVQASGRPETLVSAAGPLPAMTLCHEEELLNADTANRRFAARCAEHIVGLLNDRQAGFEQPGRPPVPLRPADVAVLVRTGREAALVQRELRRRGVPSVYLSDKDSVFDSLEARDLLAWLRAVASPRDMRRARAAFASSLIGLSLEQLAAHAADDDAWEERLAQLATLHAVWLHQGVLAMLRQTLHLLELPARWLAAADGERRLTNYLHLAELLQGASRQVQGEQGLVRWLLEQLQGQGGSADERVVRLESDADLVQVVTVHKSKGLEYPLVYLPFVCGCRPVSAGDRLFERVDAAGRRSVELSPSAEVVEAADLERKREDLRLLYVALTRARHALWLGVSALKDGRASRCGLPRSAMGHLLGVPPDVQAAEIGRYLQAWAEGGADIVLQAADGVTGCTPMRSRAAGDALQAAGRYQGRFERDWQIGSFSLMVRDLRVPRVEGLLEAGAREEELLAGSGDEAAEPLQVRPGDAPWHRYPRGARHGNFLHDQLEWLADEGFALADSPELQQQLLRRCERHGAGDRQHDVLDWLQAVLATPLPPLGVPLQALRGGLPEMEFWFASDGLRTAEVDALCRRHLLDGLPRPPLPERTLRGMLMGFADQVFEHAGRYWVLDYKSNALGTRDEDYSAAALQAAMAQHRYEVQAALYLLALHRLLRARLGAGYDPARQLGGAIFLFLRGIRGPAAGCCHIPALPALLDALDQAVGLPSEVQP